MAAGDSVVGTSSSPMEEEEEEEDYMNMLIAEPEKPREKETYTQRRIRKQREAEIKGRVKSKAERESEERSALEAALAKPMLSDGATASSNKGLAMMAKMGFKPGAALGREDNTEARLEPIGISMKEDRGGIGMDTEKRRKIREEFEREGKRVKAEEGEYRDRVRREREEARYEGLFHSAMKVAERMEAARDEEEALAKDEAGESVNAEDRGGSISAKPLKQINVLWRGLTREREEKERDRRMRYDLHQSLSRLPTYDDPDEDKEDRKALDKDALRHALVEDLEEEDPELDAFNTLEPAKRLQKLIVYLRETYNYCFWCKYRYPNQDMEGCPGLTEEDHD